MICCQVYPFHRFGTAYSGPKKIDSLLRVCVVVTQVIGEGEGSLHEEALFYRYRLCVGFLFFFLGNFKRFKWCVPYLLWSCCYYNSLLIHIKVVSIGHIANSIITVTSSGHWTWLGGSFSTFGIYPSHKGESGGWPGSRQSAASGSVDDILYLFGGGGYYGIAIPLILIHAINLI